MRMLLVVRVISIRGQLSAFHSNSRSDYTFNVCETAVIKSSGRILASQGAQQRHHMCLPRRWSVFV
jgi:hypothetical protein